MSSKRIEIEVSEEEFMLITHKLNNHNEFYKSNVSRNQFLKNIIFKELLKEKSTEQNLFNRLENKLDNNIKLTYKLCQKVLSGEEMGIYK